METRKHDPLKELPRPSAYATRVGYHVGDLVTYRSQAMLVSAVVDFNAALYPTETIGLCYVLRRNDWRSGVFIIVPVTEINQPTYYAA